MRNTGFSLILCSVGPTSGAIPINKYHLKKTNSISLIGLLQEESENESICRRRKERCSSKPEW